MRKDARYPFTWSGAPGPKVEREAILGPLVGDGGSTDACLGWDGKVDITASER